MKKDNRIKTISLPLGFVLALTLALTVLAGKSQTAPLAQETPPAAFPRSDDIPFLESEHSEPDLPVQPDALEMAAGSKLVFQSYRDYNWEIYLAASNATNQVRLTNHGASDIEPRLNRGCTRIVFASNRSGDYNIYTMNLDGSGLMRLTTREANERQPAWSPDGSRIAYQVYEQNQYELYVMNADGSNQTRLTWNAAYDGEPSWSSDGSRIAYTSNQSGQYYIWVMNADGSGATQVSSQPYSEHPIWSPNGTLIAYDADGDNDGWQELWLTNPDGTGQYVIHDPGGTNTDAWARSWSPDGRYVAFTRISFVYYLGNWYWTTAYLYKWDSHGGTRQLGTKGTDWHPDLQTMDGTPPLSSMQALPALSPASFVVAWSGSDIGDAGLKSYDVQVKDGASGIWTDWQVATTATEASYVGVGGHTYYFRSRAWDWSYNIEPWPLEYDTWTMVEPFPPRTAVSLLPGYARNDPLVSWSGSDPGGSGIQTYDVQYRDLPAGSWTDWQMATTDTSATFSGISGHTYAFRSRATDKAQNIESWPSGNGDTSTTLYAWRASGTVSDNTGTPVIDANTTTMPTAFITLPSDRDGAYGAYVADSAATYSLSWDKSGYGGLPVTSFRPDQDAEIDTSLPPANNIVLNSGFESGSLSGWLASGAITPVVNSTLKHTGIYATRLGGQQFAPPWDLSSGLGKQPRIAVDANKTLHAVWAAGADYDEEIFYAYRAGDGTWSIPQNIYSSPNWSGGPQLVVDDAAVVHVVWPDFTSGEWDIYYAQRTSDGTWSSPQNISHDSGWSFHPQVSLDNAGNIHVVWYNSPTTSSDRQVFYARREKNGTWSAPEKISATLHSSSDPQLATDSSNVVHVMWLDRYTRSDVYYARRASSGTWSAPQKLPSSSSGISMFQFSMDDNDIAHVVWEGFTPTESDIYYLTRSSDGTWSIPVNISRSGAAHDGRLGIDDQENVHVVWASGGEIYYARRASSGFWSIPQNISNNASSSYMPLLAASESGVAYIVWLDYPGSGDSSDVYYTNRLADGSWLVPQNISNSYSTSTPSQLVADETGSAHVVWLEGNSGAESVYYAGPATAAQTGDSSISQAVTVPLTLSFPTLSFLYHIGGGAASNATGVNVQVNNGLEATTIFSTSTNTAAWTHHWSDLTPWAGQTVTLTFTVHETAGRPYAWAYLDEVTVGSAYPDVWVNKHSRAAAALPGQQLAFTLTYGNRGGAPASGVRLTDTLPAELSFVAASPPPLTTTPALVWDVGDLPAKSDSFSIVVTVTVSPETPLLSYVTNTASIGAASPGLETANNSVQASAFIGRRVYMPVISRDF
jgi:uncharacterized repeat protein (TIGR01451 family)